jgi:hypothetical protein
VSSFNRPILSSFGPALTAEPELACSHHLLCEVQSHYMRLGDERFPHRGGRPFRVAMRASDSLSVQPLGDLLQRHSFGEHRHDSLTPSIILMVTRYMSDPNIFRA